MPRSAVAVLLMAAFAVGGSAPQSVADTAGASRPATSMCNESAPGEEGVLRYKSRLLSVATSYANFGGSVYDRDSKTITVYGVGAPSAELRKYLADAPKGVTAQWKRSRYTAKELRVEARRLMREWPRAITELSIGARANRLSIGARNEGLLASDHPRRWLGTSYAVRVRPAQVIIPA